MNIKILDSWLREHLETDASPSDLKNILSLTSASVERLEKIGDDYLYDIEVTTNRPDLMSVIGIAKEAEASLSENKKKAKYVHHELKRPAEGNIENISIKNNPKLVNRICAVVLSVKLDNPPKYIKERLEASGIRSLNNLIDVTNYVMREIGHPAHVFDFDKITTKTIVIREASKGEKIKTLDNKNYTLPGGDIVADDGEGNIIDLLGIMGLENSVVSENTKRLLFFIDNNNPQQIRKTSMTLGIRTEAATLNEKGIDPEKAYDALLRGIELYEKIAQGNIISPIYDIYPNKVLTKKIRVDPLKVSKIIGVEIKRDEIKKKLEKLGFDVHDNNSSIDVTVPTSRVNDIEIEEDIVEEVARIYGYHKIPSILPVQQNIKNSKFATNFFWEQRVKETLKYWGFSETYTNSMVSKELFEGSTDDAVTIQNPLNLDLVYMRKTLVPSLLQVLKENPRHEEIKIFELANVYIKKANGLPSEVLTLAGVIKKANASFFEVKGILEQLFKNLGIGASFKKSQKVSVGASVFANKKYVGEVEVLDNNIVNFEINFEVLAKNSTLKKVYKPVSKYPPVIEDLALVVPETIETSEVIHEISKQNPLIVEVSLLDQFADTRTFHIVYQDPTKNLTTEEVSKIRKGILENLDKEYGIRQKNL